MRVICPICNDALEGDGENELSMNLQEHFALRHGYKNLCDLRVEPAVEGACRRTESGELADLSYGERRVLEAHHQVRPVQPGEDVMESVRCPLCGQVLFGHAFDDLSYNLSKHLNFDHALKVSTLGKG